MESIVEPSQLVLPLASDSSLLNRTKEEASQLFLLLNLDHCIQNLHQQPRSLPFLFQCHDMGLEVLELSQSNDASPSFNSI